MISKLTTQSVSVADNNYRPDLSSDQLSLSGGQENIRLPSSGKKSMAQVERARSAVGDNPAMVAQVVKNWMGSDD